MKNPSATTPVRRLAIVLAALTAHSPAATVTVDFHDAGFFGSDGRNSKEDAEALGFVTTPGGFANYHVGLSDGYSLPPFPDIEVRNFFVFSWADVLAALGGPPSGPITSATLSLYNPGLAANGVDGYISGDASEIYKLSDIGPTTTLALMDKYDHPFYGGPDETGGAMMVFSSLGTGPVFGGAVLTPASNGTYVDISLTPAGLGYLNSKLGAHLMGGDVFVGFGGKLESITPGTIGGIGDPYEEVFAFTHPGTEGSPDTSLTPPKLTLTFVPEPASGMLAAFTALHLLALRHRPRR
jgi:hypothetical protein